MEKYKVTYLNRGWENEYTVEGLNILHALGVFQEVVGSNQITKIEIIE